MEYLRETKPGNKEEKSLVIPCAIPMGNKRATKPETLRETTLVPPRSTTPGT